MTGVSNEVETDNRTSRRVADFYKCMSDFAAEMREKGIHVGMGGDPYCVTCGERWPCRQEAGGSNGAS